MRKLSHLLACIRNGSVCGLKNIKLPLVKLWLPLLDILYFEGYIQNYIVLDNNNGVFESKSVLIFFRYIHGKNCIRSLKNLNKPSKPLYLKNKHLWKFGRQHGTLVLSTSKGLFTHESCLKNGLGGKLLLFVC